MWFNRTGQVQPVEPQCILCKSSWQVGNVNLSAVNSPYMNKQLYTERICSVDNYIIKQRKKSNRYGSGSTSWTSIRGCNVTIGGCKITCSVTIYRHTEIRAKRNRQLREKGKTQRKRMSDRFERASWINKKNSFFGVLIFFLFFCDNLEFVMQIFLLEYRWV